MDRNKNNILPEVHEIEQHMTEVRNLFIQIFDKMIKSTENVVKVPIKMSLIKALSAFHQDKKYYSMGELSRNALVKMPSMTEMVDKLVKDGILERTRDANDRRVVNVYLTDKGKKIHKEFVDQRRRELCNLFGKLNGKDQADLVKALKKVSVILKKVIHK